MFWGTGRSDFIAVKIRDWKMASKMSNIPKLGRYINIYIYKQANIHIGNFEKHLKPLMGPHEIIVTSNMGYNITSHSITHEKIAVIR